MNSLELSIKHLAWSNQRFFSYFCDKSDETFALQAAVGEWPIGQILTHLAGSGEWFRYCLTGEKWSDLKAITTAEIALEYLPIMANLDATLSREFSKPDESLEIQHVLGANTGLLQFFHYYFLFCALLVQLK